jgi:hypothetical protein
MPGHARRYIAERAKVPRTLAVHQDCHLRVAKIATAKAHMKAHAGSDRAKIRAAEGSSAKGSQATTDAQRLLEEACATRELAKSGILLKKGSENARES